MDDETSDFLIKFLKGWWVGDVCYGEMFVAVLTVGGPLWAEGVTEIKNHTQSTSSPLWLAAEVPRGPKGRVSIIFFRVKYPKGSLLVKMCLCRGGYVCVCSCLYTSLYMHISMILTIHISIEPTRYPCRSLNNQSSPHIQKNITISIFALSLYRSQTVGVRGTETRKCTLESDSVRPTKGTGHSATVVPWTPSHRRQLYVLKSLLGVPV